MKTEEYNKIQSILSQYDILNIGNHLINNEKFTIWSGSSKPQQHHYGKGGLARHTLEVIELCLQTNKYYNNIVDNKQIILAALFHDSGKIYDYSPTNEEYTEWTGNIHKRKIHHISRSAIIWHDAAVSCEVEKNIEEEITHAILSHHGLREWGSPVYPSTKLAWMIHLCDGISARIDDCDKFDRY